uniref:Uncharacterized protein n=1 Tax=Manihot esculenta TaxID=3983 RepID=A0A251JFS1_MANES
MASQNRLAGEKNASSKCLDGETPLNSSLGSGLLKILLSLNVRIRWLLIGIQE